MLKTNYVALIFFGVVMSFSTSRAQSGSPNILLIIADDMGIDITNGYQDNSDKPVTPHLDSLLAAGVKFTNTWAAPQCTPTRASIMSGKYGIKTGVMRPPGNLDLTHESIFSRINTETDNAYATALIGKWHINNTGELDHPSQHGVGHYEGVFNSSVDDYYDWTKTINGQQEPVMEYATSHFTDAAIDWINNQNKPWLLWLAEIAPHGPFHNPPSALHTTPANDNLSRYIAAIEAMDYEIGRLLDNMDAATKENTVIIFIGDNGTPNGVMQFYPSGHGKGSIYEGGLRVPMFISGKGVTRVGATEDGLTHAADIYATILELVDIQVNGGVNNSFSLKPSLKFEDQINRPYNYSDYEDGNLLVWAIRDSQYKLIEDENGNQEFYDIVSDLKEENNLINNLSSEQMSIKIAMEAEALEIRSGWSCIDGIQNGMEEGIDACNDTCTDDNSTSSENIGCCESPDSPSVFYEFVENDERMIYSNNFPDHDFCHTNNNVMEEKFHLYKIDKTPTLAALPTEVVRENGRPARFFGVAMNGVKFAPAPATPFIFEDLNTGEFNWDWVFEPTTNQGAGSGRVSLDCSSGHVSGRGYHYHGNMFQYVEGIQTGISTTSTPPAEPLQIGWASDGFPVLYRFGPDENGVLKELQPSYQLKAGLRPGDGISAPCGPYNGKYTRDFEYLAGKGDLDACNGINRPITIETSAGTESFDYFYVITSSFPQVPRCMSGTISLDFENDASLLTGTDADDDGYISDYDCNDLDASINPSQEEIDGNNVDENCDGDFVTHIYLSPNDLGIEISPNPSANFINIACSHSCHLQVEVITISGQLVQQYVGNERLQLSNLPKGIYIARITIDKNEFTITKLAIQ